MAPNLRSSSDNKLLAALPRAHFDRLAPHLLPEAMVQGLVLREPGERFDQVYFPHSGMLSCSWLCATKRTRLRRLPLAAKALSEP